MINSAKIDNEEDSSELSSDDGIMGEALKNDGADDSSLGDTSSLSQSMASEGGVFAGKNNKFDA